MTDQPMTEDPSAEDLPSSVLVPPIRGAEADGDAPNGDVFSDALIPGDAEVVVRLSGDKGIAAAESVQALLRQALDLAGTRRVILDCDGVTDADLTFIQLLIATRKAGEQTGRDVVLSRPAGGVLAAVLAAGGLARPAGEGRGWLNPFWAGE